jgi:hypothetical protein
LVPKPLKPIGYFGINRPIVKFSELVAKHKGQQDSQEVVMDDDHLTLAYISMAPGGKTLKRIVSTTIRRSIERAPQFSEAHELRAQQSGLVTGAGG